MVKIESRIGKIRAGDQQIFRFLTDFNNFSHLIPQDKVSNWEASEDHCRFSIEGIGDVGLKIVDREPFKTVKYAGDNLASVDFTFWIQVKQAGPEDTRVKITLKADLNPMLALVARKPLEDFVNILVSRLEEYSF